VASKIMIPHSKVVLEEEDIAGVVEVLRSGQLAAGTKVRTLEENLASLIGVRYGAAVSSGTAALHLALLCLGIGHGSEVILPSYVCTALLNAVHYVRGTPVVVDVNPDTYNLEEEAIRGAITPKTGAIIVPHMFGLAADMDGILSLGVPVIEDCAQSVGARYKGKCTGSFGKLSIFSFYATKMICAAEGGLVLSDDVALIERIRDLRAYDEKEAYSVRYNYKLTDIQAALVISQLKRWPGLIRKRRKISRIYDAGLEGHVSRIPVNPEGSEHSYYRYVIQVDDPIGFLKEMRTRGVECRKPVFKPLHRYLNLSGFPMTELAWSKAVSIPIYPSLSEIEADRIVDAVREVLLKLP